MSAAWKRRTTESDKWNEPLTLGELEFGVNRYHATPRSVQLVTDVGPIFIALYADAIQLRKLAGQMLAIASELDVDSGQRQELES